MHQVSVLNAEGPPVPIPNTEVKLVRAENTRLETAREDKSTLTSKDASVLAIEAFFGPLAQLVRATGS